MYLNYYRTACTTATHVVDGVKVHYFPQLYERTYTNMVYPVQELAKRVRISELPNALGKTAFILAGGNANFSGLCCPQYPQSQLHYQYKVLPNTLTQIFAHQESKTYGLVDLVCADHSACASSLHVLDYCSYLIEYRGYARVIVLAVEDAVSTLGMEFFAQAGVHPSPQASAFDEHNFGFYLGQGACTAIFEAHKIEDSLAYLVDVCSASEDNRNSLGIREDGQGYQKAMAGLDAQALSQVSIVKTHGTGTPTNNLAERHALSACLSQKFVATSYKPTIGHTMGVAGLLESILLLDHLRDLDTVPAIDNRTQEDSVFLSHDVEAPAGHVLSLAAGMGNIYTSAIWKRL